MTSDHSPVSPGSSTSSPRFIFPDMHPSSSSGHLGSDSGSSPFMSPVKREVKWEVGTPPQSSELDPAMQQVGRRLLVSQPLCFLLFSCFLLQYHTYAAELWWAYISSFFVFCIPPMQQVGREFLISPHVCFVVVVVVLCVFLFLGGAVPTPLIPTLLCRATPKVHSASPNSPALFRPTLELFWRQHWGTA